MTGNRGGWLLWRIAPLIMLALIFLVPPAIAGSALLRQETLLDPTYSFGGGQIRGAPVVARGLAMFGLALLAGTVVRRILPALVVTAITGLLLYNALDWVSVGGHWMTPDVLGSPAISEDTVSPGSYLLTDALQAPDGTFHLAYEVAAAAGFPRLTADGNLIELYPGFIAWYAAGGYRSVTIGWDASRYPEVVLRESATLLVGAVLTAAAAAGVLRNRRLG